MATNNKNSERVEKHLLFYGKNCPYSNKFLARLKEYPELNVLFKKHAVEDLDTIPSVIRQVPTIVIDGKQVLESQQAFDWLKSKVSEHLTSVELNYQNLQYSSFDGEEISNLNTSTFSSISTSSTQQQMDYQRKNPNNKTSAKESELNKSYEEYQRLRNQDLAKPTPPPAPNFSLN